MALVHGSEWEWRPSLDPPSLWSLNVAFSPFKKTSFIKLRISIQLQTSTGDKEHHFYIFLPPERIASMTAEADADNSSQVHLRLMLKERGGHISLMRSPKPSNEHGEQLLASAQWLAARPGLSIEVPPLVSLPLSHWQHFCTACADGLVTADPDHADVDHLYFGRGGHVMSGKADAESPPAYDGLAGMPSEAAQSSRKRQRISPDPNQDPMGKDLVMQIRGLSVG